MLPAFLDQERDLILIKARSVISNVSFVSLMWYIIVVCVCSHIGQRRSSELFEEDLKVESIDSKLRLHSWMPSYVLIKCVMKY